MQILLKSCVRQNFNVIASHFTTLQTKEEILASPLFLNLHSAKQDVRCYRAPHIQLDTWTTAMQKMTSNFLFHIQVAAFFRRFQLTEVAWRQSPFLQQYEGRRLSASIERLSVYCFAWVRPGYDQNVQSPDTEMQHEICRSAESMRVRHMP